jgi:hypothetical protein
MRCPPPSGKRRHFCSPSPGQKPLENRLVKEAGDLRPHSQEVMELFLTAAADRQEEIDLRCNGRY